MAAACALAVFSGKIFYNFGIPERLRTLRYSIFTGGVWNELPQAKPDGFASSLWEGASDAPVKFPGVSALPLRELARERLGG